MDANYLKRRSLEIKEWWLLRKNDPRAFARQQAREAIAARADADNQAWLADGSIGTPPPALPGPVGPAPRGPEPKEVLIGGGILVILVLILAGIGTAIGPKEPVRAASTQTVTTAPTVRTTTTTATTSARRTQAADLPAVPVGQSQTLEGDYERVPYKARVTVTDVVRTTDSTVIIRAKIDVLEGNLPLDHAWSVQTTAGRNHPGFLDGDAAFGDVVDGKVEGEVEIKANEEVKLAEVRLQPRHYEHVKNSLNATAVWTIGKLSTSITTTEPEPIPTAVDDSGSGSGGDVPNVNVPNVDVPNVGVGDCVNGRRRSNGRFC